MWTGRVNLVGMTTLSKAVYRFSAMDIKVDTNDLVHRSRSNLSKICVETQMTPYSQHSLETKTKPQVAGSHNSNRTRRAVTVKGP